MRIALPKGISSPATGDRATGKTKDGEKLLTPFTCIDSIREVLKLLFFTIITLQRQLRSLPDEQ